MLSYTKWSFHTVLGGRLTAVFVPCSAPTGMIMDKNELVQKDKLTEQIVLIWPQL